MTTDICFNVFAFINEKIFRNHRESSIVHRETVNILAANVIHQLKHKLKHWIKLIYPNDMLQFPSPTGGPTQTKSNPSNNFTWSSNNLPSISKKPVTSKDNKSSTLKISVKELSK